VRRAILAYAIGWRNGGATVTRPTLEVARRGRDGDTTVTMGPLLPVRPSDLRVWCVYTPGKKITLPKSFPLLFPSSFPGLPSIAPRLRSNGFIRETGLCTCGLFALLRNESTKDRLGYKNPGKNPENFQISYKFTLHNVYYGCDSF